MGSTLFAVLARSSYSRERAISRNGKGESRVSPRLEKSARGYFDNFFFFFFPLVSPRSIYSPGRRRNDLVRECTLTDQAKHSLNSNLTNPRSLKRFREENEQENVMDISASTLTENFCYLTLSKNLNYKKKDIAKWILRWIRIADQKSYNRFIFSLISI